MCFDIRLKGAEQTDAWVWPLSFTWPKLHCTLYVFVTEVLLTVIGDYYKDYTIITWTTSCINLKLWTSLKMSNNPVFTGCLSKVQGSIGWQLNSQTLLYTIEKKWKLNRLMLFESLFTEICFNVSSINLKENKFRNLTHIILILPIRLLDYRLDPVFINSVLNKSTKGFRCMFNV